MPEFVFTTTSLNYWTASIIAVVICLHGWWKWLHGNRSLVHGDFVGFSSAFALFVFSALGENLFYHRWSYFSLSFQSVFIALFGFFLIRFIYRFPKPLPCHPREFQWVQRIAAAIFLWEVWHAVVRLYIPSQAAELAWRPFYMDAVQVALFSWILLTSVRQAVQPAPGEAAPGRLRRFLFPAGAPQRSARALAVLFIIPVVLVEGSQNDLTVSLGVICGIVAFALIYLNQAPEQTSLIVKLVGIPLTVCLMLLNVSSFIVFDRFISEYEQRQPSDSLQTPPWIQPFHTLRFIPDPNQKYQAANALFAFESELGEPIDPWGHPLLSEEVPLPFEFPLFGKNYRRCFVSADGYVAFGEKHDPSFFRFDYARSPVLMPALIRSDFDAKDAKGGEGVFVRLEEKRAVITWNRLPSWRRRDLHNTFQLILDASGVFFFSYKELPSNRQFYRDTHYPGDVWMAGVFGGKREAEPIHRRFASGAVSLPLSFGAEGLVQNHCLEIHRYTKDLGYKIAGLMSLSSLAILLGLPLFFHRNVSMPLRRLVGGVQEVNQGKLGTRVGVAYSDEIGFLTASFNKMVESIQRSHQELHSYRAHLEETVRLRTRDLEKTKAEAEQANRAKSVFLANMSHEFRTPLHAILGFTELMSGNEELPPDHRESLNIVQHSGEHLLNMINNILALSKIEGGKETLDEEDFDLSDFFEALKTMLAFDAAPKQLDLRIRMDDGVPHVIRADKQKLKQILLNLGTNALKFTEEGEVTIGVSMSPDGPNKEFPQNSKHRLEFWVSDTGPGIHDWEQDKLFMPFEQTSTGKGSGQGTGLGLAICQHYAKMMGGKIAVESQSGEGSTFRLTLPVKAAKDAAVT